MNKNALVAGAVIAGVAAGALGAVIILNANTPTVATDYPTYRPTIKSKSKQVLEDCSPFPFTEQHHPTAMYQIKLTGTPFDIRALKPEITEMAVTAAPWTDGDPSTSKTYAPNITWTPKTPLDMDLNLSPPSPTMPPGRHSQVLIKIVIEDTAAPMIVDPFSIISTDDNRKMFCKFPGGFQTNSATFMASYLKPVPNKKTYGSYSVGVNIPATDGSYVLPTYLDPEIQNNGID